jgi:hypothetical protein
MAGDWIKMECSTPDKPEVLAITVKMGWDDPDLTVGKLFRLWRWFDQHTVDGNAETVTAALLDRYLGVSGFVEVVASVGWMSVTDSGISLPSFEKHNGASAKSRAQTAKRVANHKSNAKGNGESVTKTVTEALPREEKRREERNTTPRVRDVEIERPADVSEGVWLDFLKHRKAKRATVTPTVIETFRREAEKAQVSLEDAMTICCSRGWQGFDATWLVGALPPAHLTGNGVAL